ncbi:MAG: histidine kinase dimerization/phosphoacceptor domain -containing protein [Pirellulaceae bacterium]
MDDPLSVLDQAVRLPVPGRDALDRVRPIAERIVRVAALALATPAATLAVVNSQRQWIWGSIGLAESWGDRGRTPPAESWCRLVAESGRPLVAPDAQNDSRLDDRSQFKAAGIGSLLSVPIALPDRQLFGALAVLDQSPRRWSDDELALLTDLATAACSELSLWQQVHGREESHRSLLADLAARRWAEERFRQVVEAAPNGMIMFDEAGRIVLLNAQVERLFGYSKGDLMGRPIEILVHQRYRTEDPTLRGGFFANPQVQAMGAGRDLFGCRQDGSEFPVEIGLNPLPSEDGLFVLASIIDITERKRNEAVLLKSLREKDVLLREIHHRVKNNLQIITSLLRMQARGLAEPALVQALRESQDRIRSMALIHEKLYKSEDLARVNIADYIRDLTASLFQSYGSQAQSVRRQVEVDAIEMNLDQALPCGLILNELLSNCLKHAFPDGQPGRIWLGVQARPDGRYRLFVRDDGVGFPPQFDPSQTSSLGLRLVRSLAEQLEGTLAYSGRDGASFEIVFPPHEPTPVQEHAHASVGRGTQS